MDPISALLSTALGKAAAATAVAAVTAAGAHGAGVVELPLPDIGDKPAVVVADDTPVDPTAPTDEKSARSGGEEEEIDELEGSELEETDTDVQEDADEVNAHNDFGERVSADAQDGGVDGQVIASEAREGTPAEGHAPDHAGAPEEPGSRASEVRQNEAAGETGDDAVETDDADDADADDDAEADEGDADDDGQPPVETGPGARGNAPTDAGSED